MFVIYCRVGFVNVWFCISVIVNTWERSVWSFLRLHSCTIFMVWQWSCGRSKSCVRLQFYPSIHWKPDWTELSCEFLLIEPIDLLNSIGFNKLPIFNFVDLDSVYAIECFKCVFTTLLQSLVAYAQWISP